MIVLGVADNHDAGAALVIEGRPVAAVNQERVSRVKNAGGFPRGAIDATLAAAGVRPGDVDRVVFGTAFTPSLALRALPGWHAERRHDGQFSPLLHAYIVYQSALQKSGLHALEIDACKALLRRKLRDMRFDAADVRMMDHHEAHAQGAYRTSGMADALVLTVDGMGDGTSATAWLGQGGELLPLWRQSGLACINTFYSRVTELLGFTPIRHEGKVTGLAALAEPPPALLAHLRQRIAFDGAAFRRMDPLRPDRADDPWWAELRRWPREELAAAAQRVLEEVVCAFVQRWCRQTGQRQVAVAGGAFANVRLNQRVAELPEVDALWVCPHMGDGGLALGAALGSVGAAPDHLPHVFLGPEFSARDLVKALGRGGLRFDEAGATTSPGGVRGDVERVAALLTAGKVVGRFDGRMEWGPRALGHRSVLAAASDPGVTGLLNERLRRSDFMPFAPLVREEDALRFFPGIGPVRDAARFMTVCADASPELRRLAPAGVHVDGTARPQLVSAEVLPELHALLGRMDALTGAPVLLNTSFNLHEEPIVCTPSDAVRATVEAGLEALWIGPYVAAPMGAAAKA
jgi:carbamoyltransferase